MEAHKLSVYLAGLIDTSFLLHPATVVYLRMERVSEENSQEFVRARRRAARQAARYDELAANCRLADQIASMIAFDQRFKSSASKQLCGTHNFHFYTAYLLHIDRKFNFFLSLGHISIPYLPLHYLNSLLPLTCYH